MNDVYCRVDASKVHGVGVFAVKDIPKDTNPFIHLGKPAKLIKISHADVKKLPISVQSMLNDYLDREENNWYIPSDGLNNMNLSFYMNHKNNPNVDVAYLKNDELVGFVTNRKIKKGEELFINYQD